MFLSLLFLACGEKGGSDTGEEAAQVAPEENPNPQYIGEYNTNLCETEPAANGYAIGDTSYDWQSVDQHGETISLSDFCENTVLLVSSKFGCGACEREAPELEALYQKYKDNGFTVITLLGRNSQGGDPAQEDLQEWASTYGLNYPVLADPGYNLVVQYLWENPTFAGSIGLPNMQLLSGGMVVETSNDRLTEADILPYLNIEE